MKIAGTIVARCPDLKTRLSGLLNDSATSGKSETIGGASSKLGIMEVLGKVEVGRLEDFLVRLNRGHWKKLILG